MNPFEGKSPAERNKIIAAIVLGVSAILALGYSIIGNPFAAKKKTTVTVSTTPTPKSSTTDATTQTASLPTIDEMERVYTTTPIFYESGKFYAPDAGRNIFAFYEPPPPTPYSPTPPPPPPTPPIVPPPTPTPTPPLLVGFVTPQSVYAGSKTFRLEVNGDRFTTDSTIILNGSQLPTTYISPQKLVADVPSNFIAGAGQIFIIVRTPDGKLYSNQVSLNIQAPPVPQFQYIGAKLRERDNNSTAYFQEPGKPLPFGARLNDVVAGRFRLASISSSETVFEDVNLGFKHRLALQRPANGQTAGGAAGGTMPGSSMMGSPGRQPPGKAGVYNPNEFSQPAPIQSGDCPPGIPCDNIKVYTPPQPGQQEKKDEDDDGGR